MAAYKPRPKPTLVGTVQKKKTTMGLGNRAAKPLMPSKAKPTLASRKAKADKLRGALGKPVLQETRHVGPAPRAEEDAGYVNRIDTAEGKGEERLAALANREGDIKREFGIEDPTDPFSRANALKQSFLARAKAASAGLASQGQLYSGAHERAVSRTRREEEEARAELRRSYEGAIGQVGAEKAGVKWATEEEKNQAFEDWLARAPEAEVEVTEDEVGKAYANEEAAAINRAQLPAAAPVAPAPVQMRPSGTETGEARLRRQRQEKKAAEIVKRVGQKKALAQEKVRKQGTVVTQGAGLGANAFQAPKPKAKAKAKKKARGKGKK